jgi:hypothetical protein
LKHPRSANWVCSAPMGYRNRLMTAVMDMLVEMLVSQ